MSTAAEVKKALKGGEWLIKESSSFETFIPEDFSEEQLMIRDMCNSFLMRKSILTSIVLMHWSRG